MCKGFKALQTMKSFNFVRPLILNYTSDKQNPLNLQKTWLPKLISQNFLALAIRNIPTLLLFICSKLTIVTQEESVNYVQS